MGVVRDGLVQIGVALVLQPGVDLGHLAVGHLGEGRVHIFAGVRLVLVRGGQGGGGGVERGVDWVWLAGASREWLVSLLVSGERERERKSELPPENLD